MALTPKQKRFADIYRVTGNACEAYREAYSSEGMSAKAIGVESGRLIAHPAISLYLASKQKQADERFDVTLEKLTEMAKAAYDMAKKDDSAFGASAMVRAVAQLSRMHGFDAKERENDRMPLGDALAMVLERRKSGEVEGTVH